MPRIGLEVIAMNMVKEFNVNGVIGKRMAFCDLWLPFLKLDREYILVGVGQMRTRIQAFLETMGK